MTVLRKRSKAQSRLHQRTRKHNDFWEKRRAQYSENKATYAANIKRENIRTRKDYCNMTTDNISSDAVYKLASGKRYKSNLISTLRKQDGSLTTHTKETLRLKQENFTPEYNDWDDSDCHK